MHNDFSLVAAFQGLCNLLPSIAADIFRSQWTRAVTYFEGVVRASQPVSCFIAVLELVRKT